MRITCEQCGRDIQSESCKATCDWGRRQEQYDRAMKVVSRIRMNPAKMRHYSDRLK